MNGQTILLSLVHSTEAVLFLGKFILQGSTLCRTMEVLALLAICQPVMQVTLLKVWPKASKLGETQTGS